MNPPAKAGTLDSRLRHTMDQGTTGLQNRAAAAPISAAPLEAPATAAPPSTRANPIPPPLPIAVRETATASPSATPSPAGIDPLESAFETLPVEPMPLRARDREEVRRGAPAEQRPLVEILRDALAKAAQALGNPQTKAEQVLEILTQALVEGWGADEVVVLMERGKGTFGVLGGAGEKWRECQLKMGFRREDRHILGVAAARCEAVLIHDASDPKIDPYLPSWFKAGLQVYSCIIVPAGEPGAAHSLVFAAWRQPRKVHLSSEETRCIRALLGMMCTARRLSGQG